MRRVPGLLALTSPPGVALGRVVHALGVHLRPDAGGGLLIGAADLDALAGDGSSVPAVDAAKPLLERAMAVFPPARDCHISGVRAGVRPMPADGHTIAGRLPGWGNAWVIVTHSAITMGPLVGRLIAGEILGGAVSAALEPFRPDRF